MKFSKTFFENWRFPTKSFGPIICYLINTNMVWSQKELFYRSNFHVIRIELFVMTSGIFGFGKERIVVAFPKFAFDLQL